GFIVPDLAMIISQFQNQQEVGILNQPLHCIDEECRGSVRQHEKYFIAQLKRYYWLTGAPHHVIMKITGYSSGTITDYIGYFRGMNIAW
ncbi:1824_t:CDS:2, partial [Dentiscutata erythropus]